MSEKDQTEKLFKAMGQDDQKIQAIMGKLIAFSNEPLRVRIRDPAHPNETGIEVTGRPLKDSERRDFYRRAEKINPKLIEVAPEGKELEIALTADEQEALAKLMDEIITLSTNLPQDFLTKLGDDRIRRALFKGIMQGSSLTKEEMAEVEKFRGNRRRP